MRDYITGVYINAILLFKVFFKDMRVCGYTKILGVVIIYTYAEDFTKIFVREISPLNVCVREILFVHLDVGGDYVAFFGGYS
jgi:hypothetical protein